MHEHPKDDPELLSEIEKLGYDPRDIKVDKGMAMHAVYLYVGLGFSVLLAWGVMWFFDRSQVTVPDETAWERDRMPEQPDPLLQSNITAHKDIADLRKLEQAKSDHATWIDEDAGVARIPIAAAMEIMLEQGFEEGNTSVVEPASITDSTETEAPEVIVDTDIIRISSHPFDPKSTEEDEQ